VPGDPRATQAGKRWAREVIERDGMCMWCGHEGDEHNPLQADHRLPLSVYPELALDLDNGQALCARCNRNKSSKIIERTT